MLLKRPLLPLFLTVSILLFAGCESEQVKESMMEEIAGEYELVKEQEHSSIALIYDQIKNAYIRKQGDQWIFFFCLPGDTHNIYGFYDSYKSYSLRIYWNQILGRYMTDKRDLDLVVSSGISRYDIEYLNILSGKITLSSDYVWKKK